MSSLAPGGHCERLGQSGSRCCSLSLCQANLDSLGHRMPLRAIHGLSTGYLPVSVAPRWMSHDPSPRVSRMVTSHDVGVAAPVAAPVVVSVGLAVVGAGDAVVGVGVGLAVVGVGVGDAVVGVGAGRVAVEVGDVVV